MLVFLDRPAVPLCSFFFFFNDTATTEIYTLSLHDALPIWVDGDGEDRVVVLAVDPVELVAPHLRSEEHTSELQSPDHLVCRLLLEKKKKSSYNRIPRCERAMVQAELSSPTFVSVIAHATAS